MHPNSHRHFHFGHRHKSRFRKVCDDIKQSQDLQLGIRVVALAVELVLLIGRDRSKAAASVVLAAALHMVCGAKSAAIDAALALLLKQSWELAAASIDEPVGDLV